MNDRFRYLLLEAGARTIGKATKLQLQINAFNMKFTT